MKLGLDIHGVIDKRPEDFASLAAAVIWTGGEVHIITGGSVTEDMKEKVKAFGVAARIFAQEQLHHAAMVEVDICKSQHHDYHCESGGPDPPARPAPRAVKSITLLLKIL